MSRLGKRWIVIFASAFIATLSVFSAFASVTGPCFNCHVMHDSKDGASVSQGQRQNSELLFKDCLGCHSSMDGSIWKDPVSGAPIVYNKTAPDYGATIGDGNYQGLAGGNFYWVDRNDAHGHNIFDADSNLDRAPGASPSLCSVGCHTSLAGNESDSQGCVACHMLPDSSQSGKTRWHHADDSEKVVSSLTQGWYRFLAGHNGQATGVSGIEDPEWEHEPSAVKHNEYLGNPSAEGIAGFGSGTQNTMTGFCTGCHGDFHLQQSQDGKALWLKHPSDRTLPASGEYASYTRYDPLTPVARPALTDVSGTVAPGRDMVMCLSCHRAHASPYPDMLRFDYNRMLAGGGGADGTGCFKCHAGKDGN